MDCIKMTLDQIKDRFASDWGFGREVTDTFSEDDLRAACESGSPYLTLKMLLKLRSDKTNKNTDEEE